MDSNKKIEWDLIKILKIEKLNSDSYSFTCSRPENLSWEVGSNGHFSLEIPTGDKIRDKPNQRHMSIVSHPDEEHIVFSTRIRQERSSFKARLSDLTVGDQLYLYGLNNRIPIVKANRPLLFITMGVGIGTCRPYLVEYKNSEGEISSLSILSICKEGEILFKEEFENMSLVNFENRYTNDRTTFFMEIEQYLKRAEDPVIYPIGSDQFLAQTCSFLLDHQIKDEAIYIDKKKTATEFVAAYL